MGVVRKADKELINKMNSRFFNMFSSHDNKLVKECLDKLTAKHRKILSLFYGLDGINCLTCDEISEVCGMEKQSVTKTLDEAIFRLSELIEDKNNNVNDKNVKVMTSRRYKNKLNDKLLYEYLVIGNNDSYLKLIEINKDIVDFAVDTYCRYDVDYEEYVSIAYLALMEAINSYDLSRSDRPYFSSYAYVIIKRRIFNEFYKREKAEKMIYFNDGEYEDVMRRHHDFMGNSGDELSDGIEDFIEKDYSSYKKQKIQETFAFLSGVERDIVELSFGFRDGKIYTQKEISGILGVPSKNVNPILNMALRKMFKYLKEYENEYALLKETKKEMRMIQSDFYSLFNDGAKALKLLSLLDNNIFVSLYYGLNNKDRMNCAEIANKFNVSENDVENIIENNICNLKALCLIDDKDLSNNKYASMICKYGARAVDEVVSSFNASDQEFIKLFYGVGTQKTTCINIAKMYGTSRQWCYQRKNVLTEKLEQRLEQIYAPRKDQFYSLFKDINPELVDKAFECLYKEEQDILRLAYGINRLKLGIHDIAEKYNCSYYTISNKLQHAIFKMNEYLKDSTIMLDKKKKFYSKFEGYSVDQVNEALNRVSKMDLEVLSLYFGLNNDPVSFKEIAKLYMMDEKKVWWIIYKSLAEVKKILEKENIKTVRK